MFLRSASPRLRLIGLVAALLLAACQPAAPASPVAAPKPAAPAASSPAASPSPQASPGASPAAAAPAAKPLAQPAKLTWGIPQTSPTNGLYAFYVAQQLGFWKEDNLEAEFVQIGG